MSEHILEIQDLTVQYSTRSGELSAVNDASIKISEGEFYGIVGESGCGKSTLIKSIIGALDPNGEIVSGSIKYRGKDISNYSEKRLNKEVRWKEISWIPQSSMASLDPLQTIKNQAVEIGKTHTDQSRETLVAKLAELFEMMGLDTERLSDYPHQFSGGMEQRAIIAIALFLEPDLIIADEPTTALDVIMQDQIFKYLSNVQEDIETSMILITHDISLVFESCDRMAIMHGGQVAETGTTEQIFDSPRHPYSILLQKSFPDIRELDKKLTVIDGEPPEQYGDVDNCSFYDRCPLAVSDCNDGAPPLNQIGDDGHRVACIRAEMTEDGLEHTTPTSEVDYHD